VRIANSEIIAQDDEAGSAVPSYLRIHYWWAYVHPRAVKFFERQWLVNLILWGHYRTLRDAALAALGAALPGRTLQVACVYGDLTEKLGRRVAAGDGMLDVVDVLPVQLTNLRRKLPADIPARLLAMDSSRLTQADASYDRVLLFFLLHEQPRDTRLRTLAEAFRVVKPGGTVVIIDYAKPQWWHPLRIWLPLLGRIEPYAPDLWTAEIPLPAGTVVERGSYFGGLYQKLVVRR
jgi:ubiquinone/menaquinone biosynthesis C-methylase UbiE